MGLVEISENAITCFYDDGLPIRLWNVVVLKGFAPQA